MSEAELLITNLVVEAIEEMDSYAERSRHYRALASLSSSDKLVVRFTHMAAHYAALADDRAQMRIDLGEEGTDPRAGLSPHTRA